MNTRNRRQATGGTSERERFKSNGQKRSGLRASAALAGKPGKGETAPPQGGIKKHFPVVGIGASAGGLEAFTQFLQNLPPDTGMAFVLVQHLDPDHESALTQLLTKTASMPVS
jgi:chemotaxis response regulator CheB